MIDGTWTLSDDNVLTWLGENGEQRVFSFTDSVRPTLWIEFNQNTNEPTVVSDPSQVQVLEAQLKLLRANS
jgi:hypothetical protein